MDLLAIVARVTFSYFLLLVLVRLSGKRTIREGSAFDFTVAVIVGDLVDDVIWGEVRAVTFAVAACVLFAAQVALQLVTAPRQRA
jgi:uncharacterized membrane protein YcaP (DUF421 family)